MERARHHWLPDEGWSIQDDRVLSVQSPENGELRDASGRMQRAPEAVSEIPADPPPHGEGSEAPVRRARLADLRRAIALSEVLGPPRALRRGGFR